MDNFSFIVSKILIINEYLYRWNSFFIASFNLFISIIYTKPDAISQFYFHLTKCKSGGIKNQCWNESMLGSRRHLISRKKQSGNWEVWEWSLSCKSDSSILRDRMSLHLETDEWRRGKRTMPSALIYVIKRCNFHTMSNIHWRECRICRIEFPSLDFFPDREQHALNDKSHRL